MTINSIHVPLTLTFMVAFAIYIHSTQTTETMENGIKRPINGTGPIEISFEDLSDYDYNDQRLLIIFDRTCARNYRHANTSQNTETKDLNKIEHSIQHIQNTYRMCLTLTNHSGVTHYDTPLYSYVFFDLFCTSVSLTQKNITINYDDLCIEYITFEPLYTVETTNNLATLPANTPPYACMRLNTAYYKSYGMDLLDSEHMDYAYKFPLFINETVSVQHKVDIHILDSGVQSDHVEFYEWQVIHKMGEGPATHGSTYGDHGTHVAGIAGGKNYGASRNNTLYSYRVCEFTEDGKEMPCYGLLIFEALQMIYDHISETGKAAVINLSLGGKKATPNEDAYHYYFEEIIKVGGIPVVAAGNENIDACQTSPAYTTNAITVGSYDRNRHKSSFSNYGTCVDIWAPGTSIYSSIASNDEDSYEYKQGTSMASPYIAGMVANLLYLNPTLRFAEIKEILQSNTWAVSGSVCNGEFECRRPQYTMNCPVTYDLPHVWTTLEIVLIVLGCLLAVCIIVLVLMWVVKKRKMKDRQEYEENNWQYSGKKNETEMQQMNANGEGNGQHYITVDRS